MSILIFESYLTGNLPSERHVRSKVDHHLAWLPHVEQYHHRGLPAGETARGVDRVEGPHRFSVIRCSTLLLCIRYHIFLSNIPVSADDHSPDLLHQRVSSFKPV